MVAFDLGLVVPDSIAGEIVVQDHRLTVAAPAFA